MELNPDTLVCEEAFPPAALTVRVSIVSTSGDAWDYIQLQKNKKIKLWESLESLNRVNTFTEWKRETEKEAAKEMHRKRKCDPVRAGQEKKERK